MIRSRKLKDGTIAFYNGSKKATDQEAKKYIKDNWQIVPVNKLPTAALKRYAGAVKGGKMRAANALTDKQGRMLSAEFQRKLLTQKGIDIVALKKQKQVDTIRDLLHDENVRKMFDKVIESGAYTFYNYHNADERIRESTAETIEINGDVVSKPQALRRLSTMRRELITEFEAKEVIIRLTFIGIEKIVMTLPEHYDIISYDGDAQAYNADWGSYVMIIVSPIKKDKKKRKSSPRKKKK